MPIRKQMILYFNGIDQWMAGLLAAGEKYDGVRQRIAEP